MDGCLREDERERHTYKVEPEIRITRTCGSGVWGVETGSGLQDGRRIMSGPDCV